MTTTTSQIRQRRDRQALLVAGVVAVQAVAAVFFVADALGDFAADGVTAHILIEALIAFALLAGGLSARPMSAACWLRRSSASRRSTSPGVHSANTLRRALPTGA